MIQLPEVSDIHKPCAGAGFVFFAAEFYDLLFSGENQFSVDCGYFQGTVVLVFESAPSFETAVFGEVVSLVEDVCGGAAVV